MTMLVAEIYDALIAAGAPEEKAARAAEALASYDNPFNKVDADLSKIDSDLRLIKWMIGIVVTGIVALITKTFF